MYAERAFERMPVLADTLEEAGRDAADVLAHCLGDGPHVRGCWAVDLVLGKNRSRPAASLFGDPSRFGATRGGEPGHPRANKKMRVTTAGGRG